MLLALSAGYACHVDDGTDGKIQIGVEDDLVLDMVQTLSQNGSRLNLIFQSEDAYTCEGAAYDYTLKTSTEDIGIHLTGIFVPQPCAGGSAPAVTEMPMPRHEGTYAVAIDIGDIIHNTGILVNEGDKYQLFMNETHGMTLSHDVMFKIPDQTLWGYVYHPTEQAAAWAEVNTVLTSYGGASQLASGYYGFFDVYGTGEIELYHSDANANAQAFAFQYTHDPAAIAAIKATLIYECPVGTEIKLFTWEGEEF